MENINLLKSGFFCFSTNDEYFNNNNNNNNTKAAGMPNRPRLFHAEPISVYDPSFNGGSVS
jgi:hypothetical protein